MSGNKKAAAYTVTLLGTPIAAAFIASVGGSSSSSDFAGLFAAIIGVPIAIVSVLLGAYTLKKYQGTNIQSELLGFFVLPIAYFIFILLARSLENLR